MEPGKVETALEHRLDGSRADLRIDPESGKIVGLFIHDSFTGISHRDRVRQVWEFLREEFGNHAVEIGSILVYTPAELEAMSALEEGDSDASSVA
jgi:hypothetical protein